MCAAKRQNSPIGDPPLAPSDSLASRAFGAVRWLLVSVVAACLGALCAGVVEARDRPLATIVTAAGFIAWWAGPWLMIGHTIGRALAIAWQPRARIAALIDADGAAPRLAAWVAVGWLAGLALAAATFQGVWLLANWTAFKAGSLSFLAPAMVIGVLLAIIVLARPVARLLGWLAGKIDRLAVRVIKRSIVRPPAIAIGTVIVTAIVGWLFWVLLFRDRIGPSVIADLWPPVAVAAAFVTAAAIGRRLGRARPIAAGAIIGATALAIGTAVTSPPDRTIGLWSETRYTSLAIDRTIDLEATRRQLPLDSFRLMSRVDRTAAPDLVIVTAEDLAAVPPGLTSRGVTGYAVAPALGERGVQSLVHGVVAPRVRGSMVGDRFEIDPRHVNLIERIAASGYATALFSCRQWNVRGFASETVERDPQLVRSAIEWLARATDRPRLLWIHLCEPPSTELAGWLTAIGEPGRGPSIVAVIGVPASDADELSDRVIRHPFALAGRGAGNDPTVITMLPTRALTDPISALDILPTAIDVAGFRIGGEVRLDGRSQWAGLATPNLKRPLVAPVAICALFDRRGERTQLAAMRGTFKLIDFGTRYALYDIEHDPSERTNLFASEPKIAGELRLALTAYVRTAGAAAW